MITKELFGKLATGEDVGKFTLSSEKLSVEIIEYGAIIKSIVWKNDNTDFVLGYENIAGYESDDFYFGTAIGRHAGRINPATITLEGVEYNLEQNNLTNNLHGGSNGLHRQVFNGEIVNDKLVLKATVKDMNDGFPGNLDVTITYSIENETQLKAEYSAVSDKDTVIDLTNHSYFNMAGHESGSIDNHKLWLDADNYMLNDKDSKPIKTLPTEGTDFDFAVARTFKKAFSSTDEQIKLYNGIDNIYLLNGAGLRKVAKLESDTHAMEVFTDQTATIIYTSNYVNNKPGFKDNANYDVHSAVCIETQNVPNAVNMPWLKSSVYKKGEEYSAVTCYCFSAKN